MLGFSTLGWYASKAEVAVTAIRDWNHHGSYDSVFSYSAGVVPKDSAFLQCPFTPIEVHVGSADAAPTKLRQHPSAFNFGFGDFFDFDFVGSTVNSSFQKESTSNIESVSAGYQVCCALLQRIAVD